MMNLKTSRLLLALCLSVYLPAIAQNVAVVNGKSIPTSRVDAMVKQMVQQGQQDTPEMRSMIKDVFQEDSIKFKNFPFTFLTWNLGLYTLVEIRKK